jgi:hypothetical protein
LIVRYPIKVTQCNAAWQTKKEAERAVILQVVKVADLT